MGTHTTSVGCLLVTLFLLAFLFLHCFEFSSATSFFASSNMSSCFKSERDALLDLKHSLVDETNRLSSWTGDDCCRWYGIRCGGQTGHIVELDLSNPFDQDSHYSSLDYRENQDRYTLRGDQLNSLLNLKHLTHLDLSFNNFLYIQIPDFFGSLVNLRYLNLSHSRFASKNPHHLGNLSALRYLDLSSSPYIDDSLLYIDNLWWVSLLYYLKHLDLSGADLSKATNWFPAINLLPSLSVLNLGGCTLNYSIIPVHSNINFTSLLELDLSYNMYHQTNVTTTVPHWISNISGLVKLNLEGNNYDGQIPESIGTLRFLTFLDLSWNSFRSLLPNTLSQLKKLVHLELSGNMLEGPIPSEMGNLTQLRYLNLGENQFTGNIPPSSENLAVLESLIISGNQLSGNIPAFIGQLIKLQVLDLGGNRMSGVISEDHFHNLTSLIELELSFNSGLAMNFSPTWTPPIQLKYLGLDSCKVGPSFPPWIRYQRNLESLNLHNASIVDNISENHFFFNLTSLKLLALSSNPGLSLNFTPTWTPHFQLTYLELSSTNVGPRFPLWIRNQRNLDTLDLSKAGIADHIPHWFPSLTKNLLMLYLSDNKLKGKLLLIPSNLVELDVSNNLLSGHVVANATTNSLKMLIASNNLLSGAFPTGLCNMKSINRIDLSNNQLSGRLPPCLGNLKNLDALILTNNSFWGSIPNSLGSLPFLISLHLRDNKFEGLLPSSFQNLTRLVTLDLGENALTGVIPSWIGQTLSNLKVLHLQSNRFNGPIPQQLCQLLNLQTINLASNYISGSIPSCFSKLTAMVRNRHVGLGIDLYSITTGSLFKEKIWEHMEGVERLYAADYFISIDLSNNNITGIIPDEIMVLVELKKLNLSGNYMEGRIPKQIGNLRKLISLDLSRNKFSGTIPESLSNLFSLTYLNLSFNELSGKIPTGYQLQTLNDPASYMGNWQLCGPPLNKCDGDHSQEEEHDDDGDENVEVWFYSGMGPGLLVGFLGFCGALHINKRWRNVYFRFLENVYDTLAVALAVKVARLRRKFQKHRTEG